MNVGYGLAKFVGGVSIISLPTPQIIPLTTTGIRVSRLRDVWFETRDILEIVTTSRIQVVASQIARKFLKSSRRIGTL